MKIRYKLISSYLILAVFAGIAAQTALYFQGRVLESNVQAALENIEHDFQSLGQQDVKTLSVGLEVFVRDPATRNLYLENNREKIFDTLQPFFQNLKKEYGVTHLYFIKPDGQCFVRLHNKDIYDDKITRYTFSAAQKTGKIASGIELGKTALALRVVMPYMNEGVLIGYVEFGEEIDHFLELLKGKTTNEFAVFVDKENLDRDKWRSVRQVAGLRDNWDDMADHVETSTTLSSGLIENLVSEEDIHAIEKGARIVRNIRIEDREYEGGGFSFVDAGGHHAGTVFTLIDLTRDIEIARETHRVLIGLTVVALIVMSGWGVFLSETVARRLSGLGTAAREIGSGQWDAPIRTEGHDEVGALARAFKRMAVRLKNVYEAQKDFTSTVSHELRTPLASIKTAIDIVLKGTVGEVNAEQRGVLDRAKRNVDRLGRLVNDILDLTKIESGKLEMNLAPNDIHQVIRQVIDAQKDVAAKKGLFLKEDLAPDVPQVSFDKDRIIQVLSNLLDNAIKFTDTGGITIASRNHFQENHVRVTVKDTGKGIAEEHFHKVFEKFQQVESAASNAGGGTGLGLAICREIITRHGGKIWVESKIGEGSAFCLILPIQERRTERS